eukprot:365607-Chlamydomonas_euryale.AAC.8
MPGHAIECMLPFSTGPRAQAQWQPRRSAHKIKAHQNIWWNINKTSGGTSTERQRAPEQLGAAASLSQRRCCPYAAALLAY